MAGDIEALLAPRLRREDVHPTKHGLPFSEWEILVGPSDWKDNSSGKNGPKRYSRLHNLPGGRSRPGVYEFGVAPTLPNDGSKLDEATIIPVYVGGAGNITARLQQYGRDGAHLDHGSSASGRASLGLFTEILQRGYSIVVRWAPVGSREEAKRREAELLNKYDYAWNKRGNGPRRSDSILKGLDGIDEDELSEMMRDCSLQREGSTHGSGYQEFIESEDSEHDSSSDVNDVDGDSNPSSDDDGDDDDDDDDDQSSPDNHNDSSLDNDNDDYHFSPDDDDDDNYCYYYGGDSSS